MATTPAGNLKTSVKPHGSPHTLAGEVLEVEPRITPGPILVDAALTVGSTTTELPNWQHVTFSAINSGTAATIDGSGNLLFNVVGEGYVNLTLAVQLNDANITNPAGYNVYMMWTWGAKRTYFAKFVLPPNVNSGWDISASGIVPITTQPLAIYISTDYPPGQTLYFWAGDFQLTPPQTPFPDFFAFGLPPPAPAVGNPQNLYPINTAVAPLSVAGVAQPQFAYGSATSPPASAAFPEFTTHSPSPPIVFANIQTDGVSPTTPPSTASSQCIVLGNVYGPPIGPALPSVVPPRTFMASVEPDPPAPPSSPAPAPPTPPSEPGTATPAPPSEPAPAPPAPPSASMLVKIAPPKLRRGRSRGV